MALGRHPQQRCWDIVAPDLGSDPHFDGRRSPGDLVSSVTQDHQTTPVDRRWMVLVVVAIAQLMVVLEGTVESIRTAADLVAQGRCLYCVPSSCVSALPGTTWRPLTEPASYYPWSVLWRATDTSDHVLALVRCAQTMSRRLGWLVTPEQTVR